MPYYVLDEKGNKIEAYSKQDILDLLEQVIEDQSLAGVTANTGCIDQIKCFVGNETHKMAYVTQATYNELEANNQLVNGALYQIIDDATAEELEAAATQNASDIVALQNGLDAATTEINGDIETINGSITTINTKISKLNYKTTFNGSATQTAITETGLYSVIFGISGGDDYTVTIYIPSLTDSDIHSAPDTYHQTGTGTLIEHRIAVLCINGSLQILEDTSGTPLGYTIKKVIKLFDI